MGEVIETGYPPLAAIFFFLCRADANGNIIVFAENSEPPADITVLKIKRYGTGLTQGYTTYGGSG